LYGFTICTSFVNTTLKIAPGFMICISFVNTNLKVCSQFCMALQALISNREILVEIHEIFEFRKDFEIRTRFWWLWLWLSTGKGTACIPDQKHTVYLRTYVSKYLPDFYLSSC